MRDLLHHHGGCPFSPLCMDWQELYDLASQKCFALLQKLILNLILTSERVDCVFISFITIRVSRLFVNELFIDFHLMDRVLRDEVSLRFLLVFHLQK